MRLGFPGMHEWAWGLTEYGFSSVIGNTLFKKGNYVDNPPSFMSESHRFDVDLYTVFVFHYSGIFPFIGFWAKVGCYRTTCKARFNQVNVMRDRRFLLIMFLPFLTYLPPGVYLVAISCRIRSVITISNSCLIKVPMYGRCHFGERYRSLARNMIWTWSHAILRLNLIC